MFCHMGGEPGLQFLFAAQMQLLFASLAAGTLLPIGIPRLAAADVDVLGGEEVGQLVDEGIEE